MDLEAILGDSVAPKKSRVAFWDSEQEIYLAKLVEMELSWNEIAEQQSRKFNVVRTYGACKTRYETKILPRIQEYKSKQVKMEALAKLTEVEEEFAKYKEMVRTVVESVVEAVVKPHNPGDIIEILKQLD